MISLLIALVETIVIEGLVMLLIMRSKNWLYCNLLCNMVTNPVLNLTLQLVYRLTESIRAYNIGVAVGEVAVLFGETFLYYAMTGARLRKCFLLSLVTNAASFLIGGLIQLL